MKRNISGETLKNDNARKYSGFYDKYLRGFGLDIGYKGYEGATDPVVPGALGIDLDTPGYDGIMLSFPENTLDYVFSSHCLEHMQDIVAVMKEWHRVTKIGGHIIIIVPHKFLYEKKFGLPSKFNEDHKWFFTPASLLQYVEAAILPNSYRIVSLRDNDTDFDYSLGPSIHSSGSYEIELVIKKIDRPDWHME